jgi:hypothetical protein
MVTLRKFENIFVPDKFNLIGSSINSNMQSKWTFSVLIYISLKLRSKILKESGCRLFFQTLIIYFSGLLNLLKFYINRHYLCIAICFMLVSCLIYSSSQMMKVTRSSETSVEFQLTTWRYIPEDRTLQAERYPSREFYVYRELAAIFFVFISGLLSKNDNV